MYVSDPVSPDQVVQLHRFADLLEEGHDVLQQISDMEHNVHRAGTPSVNRSLQNLEVAKDDHLSLRVYAFVEVRLCVYG